MYRSCGRTDFQEGSSERLFDSVHDELYTLPAETKIYPAHDYQGNTQSTIGEEKKYNSLLAEAFSKADAVKNIEERDAKLDKPKKMDIAVPANKYAGRPPQAGV